MTEALGRRKVSKGDIILTSEPFVYMLTTSYKGLYCDNCFKSKKQAFQRCSGCAFEWYCNVACQRSSWPLHKFECKKLRQLKPDYPVDTARLLAKIIIKLQEIWLCKHTTVLIGAPHCWLQENNPFQIEAIPKNGGDKMEEKWTEAKTRKFKDLMNHYSDIKRDDQRQEHLSVLRMALCNYLGAEHIPNEADLQGIYGRVIINSFSISDEDQCTIGTGVYLAGSVFDHSCQPNAYVTFTGTKLICRSLVDWSVLDWNKVRISYVDTLLSAKDRISDLLHRYYFTCACNYCTDQTREKISSSINCGNPSCDAPVYISEIEDSSLPVGPCTKCGFDKFSPDTRTSYKEISAFSREKLDEMKQVYYFDISKLILEKQGSMLHKLNVLRVRALDAAFESAIFLELWDKSVEFGTQNLDGMRYHYGENYPAYALMLLKLGKVTCYTGKLEMGMKLLRAAEPILRISHGTNHPVYKDQLKPLIEQTQAEINYKLSRRRD
ncbi:histone-lysine N-methyltransferase SMYD3-like isoform X2 [Palaemon carinicauda]|uniref:histone-lysine N-methyltransferase SMYD3-like isoform X2 n=1 Tax=Palaemon carinicauda TaxID=392227 RepID=UPI0035B66D0F